MPKPNLSRMTVEALMDLRKRVDETLVEHRVELQKQLERIAFEIAPELTGHGLPLSKCEAYNRVYEQPCGSS